MEYNAVLTARSAAKDVLTCLFSFRTFFVRSNASGGKRTCSGCDINDVNPALVFALEESRHCSGTQPSAHLEMAVVLLG